MAKNNCPICSGLKDVRASNCFSCRTKFNPARKGTGRNPEGWAITKRGYVAKRIHGKLITEHRFLMEQHLGRSLSKNEHIHHVNGNTTDNRISNLLVVGKSEHHRMHFSSERAKELSVLAHKVRWSKNATHA